MEHRTDFNYINSITACTAHTNLAKEEVTAFLLGKSLENVTTSVISTGRLMEYHDVFGLTISLISYELYA